MKIQLHCGFIKIDIYRCQTLTLDNEDARATGCGMLQLECNLESSNSTTGSWNVLGQRRRKQTRQKTIAGRRRLIRYTQGVIEKKRKEKKANPPGPRREEQSVRITTPLQFGTWRGESRKHLMFGLDFAYSIAR